MKTADDRSKTENRGNTIDVRVDSGEPPPWIGAFTEFLRILSDRLEISDREISVLLTDEATMRDLNNRYRGIDEPTDVLSFGETPVPRTGPLGDVVIDLAQVTRQAREYGVPQEEELRRVATHGVLHLIGYEHGSNDFRGEPMLRLQEDLLTRIKERIF